MTEPARTAWTWVREAPVVAFIRTETGSALLLLAATVTALLWTAVSPSSYESVWSTPLVVRLGNDAVGQDLRGWVDNGLMTFFFFVIGLEARRSLDLGDLRERRRAVLPLLAGLGGMAASIGIYLAINQGSSTGHGWGIAMSTDTAFALSLLSLARASPLGQVRAFMLTVVVVDDVVALLVIAIFYSGQVSLTPVLVAIGLFGLAVLGIRLRVKPGLLYAMVGAGAWLALFNSGLDPLIIGLAMGILAYASPVARDVLEQATDRFRLFREQPTSDLARAAQLGLRSALSPNERLQGLFHPWTSYVVVPLFALANAGIRLDGESLVRAVASPITQGIVIAYVVGKPIGILGTAGLVRLATGGRLRPPVGWVAVAGGGASAGIAFTVSLLIASLAFHGDQLQEAKVGVLAAATGAAGLTWLVFRLAQLLPQPLRARALLGVVEPLVDLVEPVDPDRDHVRGPADAPVTLLEYGDLQCPYCGQAEPAVRALLAGNADVRYVWRHLPLPDVHPQARLAAEATEAAGRQGRFWEMHDLLLSHQDALSGKDLIRYAHQLGMDGSRFKEDLTRRRDESRIAADVDSAAASGVLGTPTFFVNGRRHHGSFDLPALLSAVQEARERVARTPAAT